MRWYVGVVLLLLAAPLLQSGPLAYSMYVLLGLLIVSRLLTRAGVNNLSATRRCDVATAEIGDRVKMTVEVHNDGGWPVPWVVLEDLLPNSTTGLTPRLRVKGRRAQVRMLAGRGEAKL